MKNESVLKAIELLYDYCDLNGESLLNDIKNDYLTENVTKNGRDILWYFDGSIDAAIYIDTLTFLSIEELNELV